MAYDIVASRGFRPHTQRRVRAGFAPASLFWPDAGHRTPATCSITPSYSIHRIQLSISLIPIFKLRFLSNESLLIFSIIPDRNLQRNTYVAGGINFRNLNISCHFMHLPRGFYFKGISKLSQRMATTYRLLIAIEHTLPNCPLVDFQEEREEIGGHFNASGIGILQKLRDWISFSLIGSQVPSLTNPILKAGLSSFLRY